MFGRLAWFASSYRCYVTLCPALFLFLPTDIIIYLMNLRILDVSVHPMPWHTQVQGRAKTATQPRDQTPAPDHKTGMRGTLRVQRMQAQAHAYESKDNNIRYQ